jgi:putative tryptophan/tyrosine transport system substrate-binding protein
MVPPARLAPANGISSGPSCEGSDHYGPIVFLVGADPVKSGLVTSLNRPEGNLTGIGFLINTLAPKQLEVLHELVPKAITVGMLVNTGSPNAEADTREVEAAARSLGHQLVVLDVRTLASQH